MKTASQLHRLRRKRGPKITIFLDGRPIEAYEGETIATALLAAGGETCQTREDKPTGVFCNIGVCHGCLMTVDGQSGVKTCATTVYDGQRIETRRFEPRRRPQ